MSENKPKRNRLALLPIGIVIALTCVMALAFYPIMHMQVRDLPVAILSQDAGTQTPQGKMNAGNMMVDKMVKSGNAKDSPMKWTKVSTKADLDKALDNHEYYAAVVIPKDFTEQQMKAKQTDMQATVTTATAIAKAMMEAQAQGMNAQQTQQAAQAAAMNQMGGAQGAAGNQQAAKQKSGATIEVTLDNGKSPMVSTLLKTSLTTALGQSGVNVKTRTINAGDDDSSQMMAASMGQNVVIMPAFMMSVIASIITVLSLSRKRYTSKAAQWKRIGLQLAYALGISLLVALGADCVHAMVSGNWLPGAMIPFLWLSSFAIMSVVIGLGNFHLVLGALVGVLTLFLGMTSGILAKEMLPDFWRDWIYPWVPQHFIGDGYRAISLSRESLWNSGTSAMLIIAVVGLCCAVVAGLLPKVNRQAEMVAESKR